MLEAGLFEALVGNYLSSLTERWKTWRADTAVDYMVESTAGRRIGIIVQSAPPGTATAARLKGAIASKSVAADDFVVVTPETPDRGVRDAIADPSIRFSWIGINDLPLYLGETSPGDLTSPQTAAELQRAALVGNLRRYEAAPSGPQPRVRGGRAAAFVAPQSDRYLGLVRQLPYRRVAALQRNPDDAERQLRLGQRITNATIVLSDLKNFSSLVSSSPPDLLNDRMAKYYRRVRDAVFAAGGMLDKFIGDAVLAIFGYPETTDASAVDALKFARELIQIGTDVLKTWHEEINAVVETGTRIGVSTGDLWPLNIGERELELTLLGDSINLAARLEKNSAVNGVLMDNRTRSHIQSAEPGYVAELELAEVTLAPSDAKGQQFAIRAWQFRRPIAGGTPASPASAT